MKRAIGVDLHTTQLTVCYYKSAKDFSFAEYGIGDLESFKKSLLPDDYVVFESTGNSNYLYRELSGLVKCEVINTKMFKVITKSCSKTDKNDSYTLAEFASKDILPKSRVKTELQEDLSSVLDTRERLVKARTVVKNKIGNLLNRKGIKLGKSKLVSKKQINTLLALPLNEIASSELAILISELEHLNNQVEVVNNLVITHANKLPGFDNLLTIKGLGTNSAVALLCTIGNVNDFSDIKKLSAYIGLVPRVSNSNETVHHGKITKCGSSLSRKYLINCANIAIKYNPALKGFCARIRAKKGYGKAIVATARKLLAVVYATLVNNWYFTDFCANQREIRPINWSIN